MSLPRLVHLYVNPSAECNLACAHCWIAPARSARGFRCRERRSDEFPPDAFRRLLGEAVELGLARVKFTGSEPLLREDFPELHLAAAAVTDPGGVDVETNGTLEPPGLWEAFGANPPGVVSVSLDSADPATHDGFRGAPGAWARSRAFVERLVRAGIRTQIIMSVAEPDVEPVIRMASLCGDLGVSGLKVNPVQPIGRGLGFGGHRERAAPLIAFAARLFEVLGPRSSVDVPPAFVPLDRLGTQPGCPLLHLLGILPDGGISLCGIGFTRPALVMGNLHRDSLRDIWRSAPVLERLRTEIPGRLEGICADCIHRASCMGKCVMQGTGSSGSFTTPFWLCAEADREGLFPPSRRTGGHAPIAAQG